MSGSRSFGLVPLGIGGGGVVGGGGGGYVAKVGGELGNVLAGREVLQKSGFNDMVVLLFVAARLKCGRG